MRLFGLYALIAVTAAGYSGYWYFLADQAETAIDAQVSDWRADGLEVSYDESRVYGYPYRLSSDSPSTGPATMPGAGKANN